MTASVSHHAIALIFVAAVRVLKPRAPGRCCLHLGPSSHSTLFLLAARKELGWPSRRCAWDPNEETDELIPMRTSKRQITRGRHGAPLPYPAVPMITPRAWDCSALRNSWRALVASMSSGHIKLVERRGKERETRARPWERLVRDDALLPMKGCCATMMQMALSPRRTMGTARQWSRKPLTRT